jgi:F-type H+-transporting ATPase subunit a
MSDINLGVDYSWDVGWIVGFKDHPFFMVNVTTVMHTWIIMLIIVLLITVVRILAARFLMCRYALVQAMKILYDLVFQSLGFFSLNHFSFIGSLFLFVLMCNIAPVVPFLEEPTQDINTTLALGLCSFFYIQAAAIAFMGFWRYLCVEFFSPLWLLPLHVVGKMASVLSVSLRLFGNIFGGAIITKLYVGAALQYATLLKITHYFLLNVGFTILVTLVSLMLSTVISVFFTILEGFLQAFVFTILSLTYLSIAIRHEGEH